MHCMLGMYVVYCSKNEDVNLSISRSIDNQWLVEKIDKKITIPCFLPGRLTAKDIWNIKEVLPLIQLF